MGGLREIKKVEPRVKDILRRVPETRDNYGLLEGMVWYEEVDNPNDMKLLEFLRLRADGKLTSSESIGRARRKIQEKHVELRGKNYKSRKSEEGNVRDNINNDDDE